MTGFADDGERRDFFVSYTAVDRGWAEWIAWQLEDAGYRVLLQAWDMVVGSNWLRMMNQATRFAERTIAVLSNAYLTGSAFGEVEWLAAYRRDPAGLAGRVIPIRVEECTPDGLLAGIVYADLVGMGDKTAAKMALLDAVRAAVARRSKPLVEPDFPGTGPVLELLPAAPLAPSAVVSSEVPRSAALAGDYHAVGAAVEGVVVAGDGNTGAVEAGGSGSLLALSEYAAQVRQIAPGELVGRDVELAAMAAFGTDAAAGSYVWWRAAAWTGKTALMATFVLDLGCRAFSGQSLNSHLGC